MKGLLGRLSFVAAIVNLLWLLAAFSAEDEKAQDVADTPVSPGKPKVIRRILAIPARQQWDDNKGYCGETCIQSFAMYYGAYISQYQVRAMIDPDQKHELVISENGEVVLKNLHMTYQPWDGDQSAAPQCKSYLAWTKRQLSDGHPVIGTAYMKGENDPDYDHILPFIGFQSSHDATNYYDDDDLVFYDNYEDTAFTRSFMRHVRHPVGSGQRGPCVLHPDQ